MTDPLETLRSDVEPVDPDPAFAAALRARLERALLAPEETPVTTSTIAADVPTLVHPHTVTPMLRVADARAAVDFYVAAFGAGRRDDPVVLPDGRVAHVEVTLGDSVLMLADDNPELGLLSPARGGGTGQTLQLETADPDGVVATAVRAGAELQRPVADEPYGRTGVVVDPDGHRWMVTRPPARPAAAARSRLHTVTAYIAVVDARASVEFYVGAFGATRRGEPIIMPDGRVGHIEVALGDSILMMADEFPEMGLVAPVHRGGPSQSLRLETPDPDGLVAAAEARGARVERPVTDSPYGRTGVVIDADGHRWMISREAEAAARPGEIVYASLWTPDPGRTVEFYTRVLAWEVTGGHIPDRRLGTAYADRTTLMCCYRVPDVDATLALITAAGGTAREPTAEPWGRTALCADDQGLPFAVTSGEASPLPGGPGSLASAELRVPDTVRARAFYGTVLGWRFTPGAADDYWHVVAAAPAIELAGGHPAASAVPRFRVADVEAAAAAVRAAGGRAAEPVPGPRGREAGCVDDQGAAFVLVQP